MVIWEGVICRRLRRRLLREDERMTTKIVHYVGMTFVVSQMPQDKPVMCGVVTQNGELRAYWRDPEYRGDDKMTMDFNTEIAKSMVTGEIPIPIFTFVHPDNKRSNGLAVKGGLQLEKVVKDGEEWNMWVLKPERVKVIMGVRKRFIEAITDEERQGILDEYVSDFEMAVKDKIKLGEAMKVK